MRIERAAPAAVADVPLARHLLVGSAHALAPLWLRLAAVESRWLRKRLSRAGRPRLPIYVCGMARAGTTITLELLSQHPEVACHRYRDMAQPFLPYAWNRLIDTLPMLQDRPAPRIHHDGIEVTRDSPEAVEEALWMRFFPGLHDEAHCAVLDGSTRDPAFESCYVQTLAKLLLVHGRARYLSKANYNLTRLGYIACLLPDARFIVVVREPEAHFASWIKQHDLFCEMQTRHPRWRRMLARVGHHEFGLDQRFIHTGDAGRMHEIRTAWNSGQRARAFGLYWSALHGHLLDLLDREPHLREQVLFMRHEELCKHPGHSIDRLLDHARLDAARFSDVRDDWVRRLQPPAYYHAVLSQDEREDLRLATRDVARRLEAHR